MPEPRRYYVRSPDGRMIFGLDLAGQRGKQDIVDILRAVVTEG